MQYGVSQCTDTNLWPSMDWNSVNLLETFKKFWLHVELIFAGALADKTAEVQVTYLLLWVGEKGLEIYNTLTLTDAKKAVLQICKLSRHMCSQNQTLCLHGTSLITKYRVTVQWNNLLLD